MRWELDPEQTQLQAAFGGWLRRAAPTTRIRAWGESGNPGEFEEALAAEGWCALGVPEERGGAGGGLVELALAQERLGAAGAPSAGWTATALALPTLDDATAGELIEEGGRAAIVAPSDRPLDHRITAGAGAGGVELVGGRLEGAVSYVLGADRAEVLVVPAGGRLHRVRADAEGVEIGPVRLLDRSRSAGRVVLRGVAAAALDADADAALALAALRAAVLVAADALGAATRMRELAVEYAGQREQFGVPIGSFQAVKHTAAEMLVAEEAARSIVLYAAASVDAGLAEAPLHAAAAKAQATGAGFRAAESALTLHGAIGYTWEHDLQLLYKRARLDHALFGAPEVWNERIASALDLIGVLD